LTNQNNSEVLVDTIDGNWQSINSGDKQLKPNAQLSNRERECLVWLCHGLRTQRIANRMGISVSTVEFHLRNARNKLGAATREQTVATAVKFSLI